jgi:cell division protein FtsX
MNEIFKTNTLLSVVVSSLLLTGCFGSSNNTSSDNTATQTSTSTKIAIQKAEGEPANLDAIDDINMDISELFGNADDKPISLQKSETLNAIFDRVGS